LSQLLRYTQAPIKTLRPTHPFWMAINNAAYNWG